MSALKEEVQNMIANLPDDCTVEDIQYHLYVIEKVQNGLQDIKEDKTPLANAHKELLESRLKRIENNELYNGR